MERNGIVFNPLTWSIWRIFEAHNPRLKHRPLPKELRAGLTELGWDVTGLGLIDPRYQVVGLNLDALADTLWETFLVWREGEDEKDPLIPLFVKGRPAWAKTATGEKRIPQFRRIKPIRQDAVEIQTINEWVDQFLRK